MPGVVELPRTMYEWFHHTARRFPDLTALEVDGQRFSYARLDQMVVQLATLVAPDGAQPPRTIGILCARGVAAYASYLAAQRIGAVAVPLSPSFPPARTTAMCEAARVDTVIIDDDGAAQAVLAGTAIPARTIRLAGPRWWAELPAGPVAVDPHKVGPDEIAYVLFTSGSTGRPKGVAIRHRQLADYLDFCVRRYAVAPGSRLSQTFELTFDPSVFDMFVCWRAGATLVMAAPDEVLLPARFVNARNITHWFSVPSVITVAGRLRGLRPGSMPGLQWSLFAGEQLTLDQARIWATAAPNTDIENLYGPTELTITCTSYRLPRNVHRWPQTANATVPIGRPYPHLEVMLNPAGGEGDVEGELCVRGSQRFDGYLDPSDNAGRFLRIHDGVAVDVVGLPGDRDWYRTGDRVRWQGDELVHLGRIDDQVKISGYRIEPSDIEVVLRTHPHVHHAVILAVDVGAGQVQLQGLYTGQPGSEPAIIEHARQRLPAYMVPARLMHLHQFPTNSHGKIDRQQLRQLLCAAPDSASAVVAR